MELAVPQDHIEEICQQLKIETSELTNSYLYGSRVQGCHTCTSDYDLLLIVDREEPPLVFKSKHRYFYEFEQKHVQVDGRNYDILYHSVHNFEILLHIQFLMFTEALFADNMFKTVRKIDWKTIYLEKYFSVYRLRKALVNERNYSLSAYHMFRKRKLRYGLTGKWAVKKMFNGLRYHNSILELMNTGNIIDFGTLNATKKSVVDRYEKERDECVTEIFEDLNNEMEKLIPVINALECDDADREEDMGPLTIDQLTKKLGVLSKAKRFKEAFLVSVEIANTFHVNYMLKPMQNKVEWDDEELQSIIDAGDLQDSGREEVFLAALLQRSRACFARAAGMGHVYSRFCLGELCEKEGRLEDALAHFQLARDLGCPVALNSVERMHLRIAAK